MTIRMLLLSAVCAVTLSACADLGLPEEGFLTHAFDSDEDEDVTAANGCTAGGCPQAPSFCVARGYSPGTTPYQRCLASVEDNLRKARR